MFCFRTMIMVWDKKGKCKKKKKKEIKEKKLSNQVSFFSSPFKMFVFFVLIGSSDAEFRWFGPIP